MNRSFQILALCVVLLGCRHTPAVDETPAIRATAPDISRDESEGWLKGQLTCLDDGALLEFRIQRKLAWRGLVNGGVAAIDATTGERFTGQYSAVVAYTGGGIAHIPTRSGWPLDGQVDPKASSASAIATLTNNTARRLQLQFTIAPGWHPHGVGTGRDNQGKQYHVQF